MKTVHTHTRGACARSKIFKFSVLVGMAMFASFSIAQSRFHAQSGSSFHAKIDADKCTYCGTQGMRQGGNKPKNNENYSIPSQSELENEDEVGIKIYPNPAIEITYIEVDEVETYPYQVYDLMGNLIKQGIGRGKTALHLKKGVYIVKLKINTSWYTRKLIMY